jgi:hypothetical protein
MSSAAGRQLANQADGHVGAFRGDRRARHAGVDHVGLEVERWTRGRSLQTAERRIPRKEQRAEAEASYRIGQMEIFTKNK